MSTGWGILPLNARRVILSVLATLLWGRQVSGYRKLAENAMSESEQVKLLITWGEVFTKQSKGFDLFKEELRQLATGGAIPSLSLLEESQLEVRLDYVGRQFAIRFEWQLGENWGSQSLLKSYRIDPFDSKYTEQKQLFVDHAGNVDDGQSRRWNVNGNMGDILAFLINGEGERPVWQ